MKFVYCGYDFAIDTVLRLLDRGHHLIGILTFPCDNVFSFNTQALALAQQLDIPIIQDKPDQAIIDDFIDQGAELFLAMGYLYKIPPIDFSKAYGVNVHPSYLPQGRSVMPLPHILMHAPEAAGMTAHQLTQDFDAGDILIQEKIELSSEETVETLSCKMAMRMPDMIEKLISDLPNYWQKAQPQNESEVSNFPAPDDEMRRIDWKQSVDFILKQHRAFGGFGVLFELEGKPWVAYRLMGWQESHSFKPGAVRHMSTREIVIAAKNGFICISQAQDLSA